MWNVPTQKELDRIPRLYGTEEELEDKVVHLHFFVGGTDTWVFEYDGDDLFYGFTCLNGDGQMAEAGYISFSELKAIRVQGFLEVDREVNWKPKPFRELWDFAKQARKLKKDSYARAQARADCKLKFLREKYGLDECGPIEISSSDGEVYALKMNVSGLSQKELENLLSSTKATVADAM